MISNKTNRYEKKKFRLIMQRLNLLEKLQDG